MKLYLNTLGLIFLAAAVLTGDTTDDALFKAANLASQAEVVLPFTYTFSVAGRLEETGAMAFSSSPYWWVNSGGFMDLAEGVGQTNQGSLAVGSKWQKLYASGNPTDTDNGTQPQNIFRLLLRTKWQNTAQQVYGKITKYNLSASPNRAESNGILLMSRYLDQDNLYYAGLRVDGYAVIKKKKAGAYYTLAYKPVFTQAVYNRKSQPNLLPVNSWVGIKSEVKNLEDGKVSIKLYSDVGRTGNWTLVAEAVDDGTSFGGSALTAHGHIGIRTDFMDIKFDDFKLFGI